MSNEGLVNSQSSSDYFNKHFGNIDFGSKRIDNRFILSMCMLAQNPDQSILMATGSRSNAKAIYRMLANDKFDTEVIIRSHLEGCESVFKEQNILLAIQDTMSVNYNSHHKTEGLGYAADQVRGINVHSCLLTTHDGIPISLAAQYAWTRPQSKDDSMTNVEKQARPIEEKESFRWLETLETAKDNVNEAVKLIHIADREADIYELFALAVDLDELFVFRVVHNRIDTEGVHIMSDIRKSKVAGTVSVTIPPNRQNKTKERDVTLSVQFMDYNLKKPAVRKSDEVLVESVTLTLVRLYEENPEPGTEPIEWFLVTNIYIDSPEMALFVSQLYKARWKIERFHYTLKSGCKIENIQQRSVDGIVKLILMYSYIAIYYMQVTFLARTSPDTPCDILLSELEYSTLFRVANETNSDPVEPPTMQEVIKYLAKLGGFVGAPSDGPPGLKVIWTGLSRLFLLVQYRQFLCSEFCGSS